MTRDITVAEPVGFEPTVGSTPTQLFESCTFGRSDTVPCRQFSTAARLVRTLGWAEGIHRSLLALREAGRAPKAGYAPSPSRVMRNSVKYAPRVSVARLLCPSPRVARTTSRL